MADKQNPAPEPGNVPPRQDTRSPSGTAPAAVPAFALRSADFGEGETLGDTHVYDGMGCTGRNMSPALDWTHAPAGAKSFAVTLYDPDAPTGSGWWHWVVYNIPASITRLPAGAGDVRRTFTPGVVQGRTDFGKPGYGGPCPPKGDKPHRYVFTVYALDVDKLDLPQDASAAAVGFNLHAHALASATLTARYGR